MPAVNADLSVTPRKVAADPQPSASRNARQANAKSTSTGSNGMLGLVRAAAAVRRSKKDGLARRSGEPRGEYGPGFRASAGSKGPAVVVPCPAWPCHACFVYKGVTVLST